MVEGGGDNLAKGHLSLLHRFSSPAVHSWRPGGGGGAL